MDEESIPVTVEVRPAWSTVVRCAISPAGDRVAVVRTDRTIQFWCPATGRLLRTGRAGDGWIHDLVFAPDGRWLAACARHEVRIWDPRTGDLRHVLTGRSGTSSLGVGPGRHRPAVHHDRKRTPPTRHHRHPGTGQLPRLGTTPHPPLTHDRGLLLAATRYEHARFTAIRPVAPLPSRPI